MHTGLQIVRIQLLIIVYETNFEETFLKKQLFSGYTEILLELVPKGQKGGILIKIWLVEVYRKLLSVF